MISASGIFGVTIRDKGISFSINRGIASSSNRSLPFLDFITVSTIRFLIEKSLTPSITA